MADEYKAYELYSQRSKKFAKITPNFGLAGRNDVMTTHDRQTGHMDELDVGARMKKYTPQPVNSMNTTKNRRLNMIVGRNP